MRLLGLALGFTTACGGQASNAQTAPKEGAHADVEPSAGLPAAKVAEPVAEPVPNGAAKADVAAVCSHDIALLKAGMPPEQLAAAPAEFETTVLANCTRQLEEALAATPEAGRAYAECVLAAESKAATEPCRTRLSLAALEAELAGHTRAALPDDDQACRVATLPATRLGAPAPAGARSVQVSTEAICFDGTPILAMVDGQADPAGLQGHAIGVLNLAAQRAWLSTPEADRTVKLSFDAQTQFRDVVHVMYTLGKAEVSEYWIETTSSGGTGFVPVSAPKFGRSTHAAKVFILEDGLRWRDRGGESGTLAVTALAKVLGDRDRWPLAALQTQLAAIEAAAPEGRGVVVSAENTIPVGVLAAVIEVAMGPDCPLSEGPTAWNTTRCRFPDVTIEAGAG
ncbi:MAG: hypothetical protein AAF721_40920 [Myxococcota bacterium]